VCARSLSLSIDALNAYKTYYPTWGPRSYLSRQHGHALGLVQKRHIKSWIRESLPLLHAYTTALRTLLHAHRAPSPKGSEAESDTESEDEDFDRDFDTAVRDAMAQHGTVTLSSTGFDRIMANARS